jgi:secondary thiamine-phosphate synthase enzyme
MRTLVVHTDRRTQLVDITAEGARGAEGREWAGGRALRAAHHRRHRPPSKRAGASKVAAEIEAALERLVDESWKWRHSDVGDRNPWAHVRSALTASSVAIPLQDGELVLGELQTIFLCECDGPRERKIHLTVT